MASLSHPIPFADRRSGELLARLRARLAPTALDHDLAAGTDPRRSAAHRARAERLVSPTFRAGIALGLERTVEAAAEPPITLSSAVPVRREEVLDAATELQVLASLVREAETVAPAGVARARLLLIEGTSPLYDASGAPSIKAAARQAADSL